MTTAEIESKVREILAQKLDLPPESITGESRLAEDLGVDSFGAVEVMFEIEEAFALKVPDSEMAHVRTVQDIVVYLKVWLDRPATSAYAPESPPAPAPPSDHPASIAPSPRIAPPPRATD